MRSSIALSVLIAVLTCVGMMIRGSTIIVATGITIGVKSLATTVLALTSSHPVNSRPFRLLKHQLKSLSNQEDLGVVRVRRVRIEVEAKRLKARNTLLTLET